MNSRFPHIALPLFASLLAPTAVAQDTIDLSASRVGGVGAGDFSFYGEANGLRGYSMASTVCNVGTLPVSYQPDEVHIGQNLFRYFDGRLEQLSYSWVIESFCPINENICGSCVSTNCASLGVGCASTHGTAITDGQNGHDKSNVSATRGVFTEAPSTPSGPFAISGRLQAPISSMGVTGARYLAEVQFLSQADHADGNGRNNVSWREVNTSAISGTISGSGHTIRQFESGLEAWSEFEQGVTIRELVNDEEPGAVGAAKGHYVLGYHATELGGGQWRYEYAVQNLTSDQAARSFSIPVDCGVQITDLYFHDVDRHSGTPWSNTDWSVSTSGGQVKWTCTETFSQNPDANALRWGELFNFGFTANSAPLTTIATLGLFAPGSVAALSAIVEGPCGSPICGASSYCVALPNSTTLSCAVDSTGSTSVAANDLVLRASDSVPGQAGLFFYGPLQAQVPFGGGFLCVSGGFFRLNPPQVADAFGGTQRFFDLTVPPANAGAGAIHSGSSWNFQFWYRDPAAGGSGFNLSDGWTVVFCP